MLEKTMNSTKLGSDALRADPATESLLNVRYIERRVGDDFLVVTDHQRHGSLFDYRKENETLAKVKQHAAYFMLQMADAFLALEKVDCGFLDSKLENWLIKEVDGKHELCLSDHKALAKMEVVDTQKRVKKHKTGLLLVTPGFFIPELHAPEIDLDKAHAMLLGKNLYYYLTGRRFQVYDRDDAGAPLFINVILPNGELGRVPLYKELHQFDRKSQEELLSPYPIFNDIIGQEYQKLIQGLVKEKPEERMPLTNAKAYLRLIKALANNPDEVAVESIFSLFHLAYQPSQTSMMDDPSAFFDLLEQSKENDALKEQFSQLSTALMAIDQFQDLPEVHQFRLKIGQAFFNAEPVQRKAILTQCENFPAQYIKLTQAIKETEIFKGSRRLQRLINNRKEQFFDLQSDRKAIVDEITALPAQVSQFNEAINRLNELKPEGLSTRNQLTQSIETFISQAKNYFYAPTASIENRRAIIQNTDSLAKQLPQLTKIFNSLTEIKLPETSLAQLSDAPPGSKSKLKDTINDLVQQKTKHFFAASTEGERQGLITDCNTQLNLFKDFASEITKLQDLRINQEDDPLLDDYIEDKKVDFCKNPSQRAIIIRELTADITAMSAPIERINKYISQIPKRDKKIRAKIIQAMRHLSITERCSLLTDETILKRLYPALARVSHKIGTNTKPSPLKEKENFFEHAKGPKRFEELKVALKEARDKAVVGSGAPVLDQPGIVEPLSPPPLPPRL